MPRLTELRAALAAGAYNKQDEAYRAAIVRFRAVNYEHVLRPPFNKSRPRDIENTAAQHGIKLPRRAARSIRYLRRNPKSVGTSRCTFYWRLHECPPKVI